MQILPWLFGLATAFWFGLMARKSGRSAIGWAVGGGLFGLVTSTFVMGLSHAVFIPESQRDYMIFQVKEFLATALILGVMGWLITASIHHQPATLWRKVTQKTAKSPTNTGR
jgi:hypothetical protein